MKNYPYVLSKKRLVEFITKVPRMGIPSKVDKTWLTQAGFPTENDERFLAVLKYLDFIDNNGSPREYYKNFRGNKAKGILATAIKNAYADLFEMHPTANQLSAKELHDYFIGVSGTGTVTVERMVMTFQTLCENADFDEDQINGFENITIKTEENGSSIPVATIPTALAHDTSRELLGKTSVNYSPMTPVININIQLTIPDTKDNEVYDNFFAAMRKHLFQDR
jgi:hypothetical protein